MRAGCGRGRVGVTGEDEVVVAVELLEAGGEGAVVDEAAGFVDDEEGEDDHGCGWMEMTGMLTGGERGMVDESRRGEWGRHA